MFYVLNGTVTFEVGGERFTATDGSAVFAPRGLLRSYLTGEETRWLMFVREPGLERPWASVGSPAESWTIPDDSEVDERMNRVVEQVDRYGIEIGGDR